MSLVLGNRLIANDDELVLAYRENLNELGFCSETLYYSSETPHRAKMADVGAVVSREVLDANCRVLI